ncbi:ATP-binding protein [Pseudacidovorax sp. RU35E]|uniref:hybrid sensor histidine kinase/response regulator n=1 Tax=Pseudacidovorax sp. RU35E TaxID=1907403 RepID=UPI000956B9EC|nr:ATP-binding protein [Pseudacidovorax sp. RU35E]SIR60046.1 Signal transduction histidine kinase [Pseudacidovorax sp. RU35E]
MHADRPDLLAALDSADVGLFCWRTGTDVLALSGVCKAQFGLLPGDVLDKAGWLAAVHPDDRAQVEALVMHGTPGASLEHRIQRSDRRQGWLRMTLCRVETDAAGAREVFATSQDITDLQLAGRRLALLDFLARDLYGGAFDAAEVAFRAAEALGRTLGVSRAGYGTVDKQRETITIERDWNAPGIASLAGTLHFRDYGSYIEDLKRGETVVFADACLDPRTCDTADALIAISAQAVINMPVSEDGDLVALLYLNHATARIWTDEEMSLVREVAHRTRQVVERRRAEQELRELAHSLEAQVQQRTEKLMRSESALRQAQKMEAVGQLTAGLAHDFNNLLAAVSGSLDLLKRRLADEPTLLRYVDTGQNATRRAAALTHRLLAFSRQQTLEPRAVDFGALIHNFQDLIRRTIGPEITLEVHTAPDLWAIHVDPTQLESALLNLCINARDAMPEGGVLRILATNRPAETGRPGAGVNGPDGPAVSICVEDDGCGMTPETLARAFDPFFTTKPLGMGTGLGLSMVYGFAQQSGGVAHIESRPGEGTSVCLLLPRHAGSASGDAQQERHAAQPAGVGTVVVVDDEPAVREIMAEALRGVGFVVHEAAEGAPALTLLKNMTRPALLVTDVGLPGGMNGRHLADAARVVFPALGVLFVTGYAEGSLLDRGELPRGMQVLTKPFDLETFTARVQAMVAAAAPPPR